MRRLAERSYFSFCLVAGRVLRSAKYSRAEFGFQDGKPCVRKRRALYAPMLVWITSPLFRLLDTGVRVLPQADWLARERRMYEILGAGSVTVESDGALRLPRLNGVALADLLKDPALGAGARGAAVRLAATALADLHRRGMTHGDAMADNVLIDLDAGSAFWIDFENAHDSRRSTACQHADDVRALVATCLVRVQPTELRETLRLIQDAYGDDEVTSLLAMSFRRVLQRPLAFHLGQAPLSLSRYREIGRLLDERLSAIPPSPRPQRGEEQPARTTAEFQDRLEPT